MQQNVETWGITNQKDQYDWTEFEKRRKDSLYHINIYTKSRQTKEVDEINPTARNSKSRQFPLPLLKNLAVSNAKVKFPKVILG